MDKKQGKGRGLGGGFQRAVQWLGLVLIGLVLTACGSLQSTKPQEPDLPPTAERRELRLGLALGGGAARGFAHVGVIQVLEEAGIRPSHVAGTSAGSLVAALYASGKTPTELVRVAESMQEAEITDWMLPILNRGALRGEALAKYVNTQVGGKTLEQMQIPLGVVATDLDSGEPVTFGMPGMDGRELSQIIKTLSPNMPIIMLTGWGRQMSLSNEDMPHVNLILSKPPRASELQEALEQIQKS